ncbi:MAG: rhomboid family intramembrane serine protease [Porticoccaceae bacterium]
MTEWVKVAQFHRALDLELLVAKLTERSIDHRISVEGEAQVLWIREDGPGDDVADLVRQLALRLPARTSLQPDPLTQLRRSPVLALSLLLSIAGALIVHWQFHWVHWFTFQDFVLVSTREIRFGSFADAWSAGQYWRLFTPMFLHFGVFHIAFNGLWLWEFGRRIEAKAGSLHLLMLVLVCGAASNWSQYLFGGPSLFGGMSGVLYALLGYLWIRNRVAPDPALTLPRGVIGFMLVWLLLCLAGVVDMFMRGSIANAAHVSGLLVGMALGAIFGFAARRQ